MEQLYWQQRWERGEIAFHEQDANPLLTRHIALLGLAPASRVFVPLCGKTHDLGWLREQGFHVVGVEFSALAVDALFAELGLTPRITSAGTLQLYQAEAIDIFVGDFFELTPGPA